MEPAEKPKSTPEHVLIAVDSQIPRPASRRRLLHSKTKARFVEFNLPASSSPKQTTVSQNPQNPSAGDSDSDDEDGPNKYHEETSDSEEDERRKRLLTFRTVIQWAAVVVLSAALVLSRVLLPLSHQTLWGLTVWKWCLTLLVLFCGRLFAGWVVTFVVCLIELNFMLREKVLYFIYGLRRGVQNCIWLSFVLLTWMLLFDADVKASYPRYHRILDKITRLLIAILVGSFIWLVKIVVVKMMALSFHVSTFFDRMKESVFHQHILDTLSRKPQAKISREETMPKSKPMGRSVSMPVKSVMASMSSKRKEGKIDMERLRQLSKGSASAWGMRDLISHVMSKGLSTALDEALEKTDKKRGKEGEIKSEYEAKQAARRIFDKVDTNRNK
ncbi:hypothetical protein ACLOJK_039899 [Asimina triloba]